MRVRLPQIAPNCNTIRHSNGMLMEQHITVAEYAKRILGSKLDLDTLIERLRPSTLKGGWEGGVLEFKATYLPNPEHPDPDDKYPAKFRWDVFEAMLGMANANGGCVVVGIADKKDRTGIEPGCYDPDGIVTVKQKENKDLVEHFKSEMFTYGKATELEFSFLEKRGKDGKDEAMTTYCVASKEVDRLKALVSVCVCGSKQCACDAIVVIVNPISKGDRLIQVTKKRRAKVESFCFYRDAQKPENTVCSDISKLADYQNRRDPYDNNYHQLLRLDSQGESSQAHRGFSNVPFSVASFMGRDDELNRIREICKMDKIPLVWAIGGTGKTQLLLRYAQEHESDYPGGSFFSQLDGIKSWDGVFQRLVKEPEVRSWLGLPEYLPAKTKNGEEDPRNMVPAPLETQEIVDSIARKSKTVGSVLLVLDNIDEPKCLLSEDAIKKVFPRGLPQGLHIVASARSKDGIGPLRAPDVESVFLRDLPEDVAIALLCGGVKDERDLPDIRGVLCILGCRALYLKKVAYLIEDARVDGYPHPVQRVLHDLKRDLNGAMNWKDDDPQAPGVMWHNWVLPRILKEPDGEKIEALVRAIAFYLPTGVPMRILEGLWYSDFGKITGRKVLDAMEDDNFRHAINVIYRHGLITWDGAVNFDDVVNGMAMMHRLDQLAIRKDSEPERGEWIDRIGKALAVNPCMAPADWVELLSADGTWFRFCPWGDLNGREYAEILSANPDAASYIPDWSRISPAGWAMMLRVTTRFDDHPECRFALLNPADVLEKRPELESRFDFSKLRGWQWSDLIRKVSLFAEKCPFDLFSEDDWEVFISHDPRLSELDEIISRNRGVRALESLLQKRPNLVEHRSDEQDQSAQHSENCPDLIAIRCGVPDSQELSLRYLNRCEHLSAFVLREWPQLRPFVDMTELRVPNNDIYSLWLLLERPCFVDDVILDGTFDMLDHLDLPDLSWCLSSRHVSRAVDEKLIDWYCGDRWVMGYMLDRYPEYAEAQGLKKRLPEHWIDVLMDQVRYEEFRRQFNWEELSEDDWYKMFMSYPSSFVSTEWKAVLAAHGIPVRIKRIGEELMTLNDALPKVEYLLRELGTADANVVLRLSCNQEEGLLILTVCLDSYPEKCPKLVLSRKPAPVSWPDVLPLWLCFWRSELSNPDSHTLYLRYEGNWWSPDVTVLQIYQDVSAWLSTNPSCIGNGESVEIRHVGNAVAK